MLGIGGNTIEEAQEKMSAQEFFSWVAYRNKRGPLNLGQRIDRIGALISVVHAGGKMEDYMPWSKDDKQIKPIEISEDDIKNIDKGSNVEINRKVDIKGRKMLNLQKNKEQKEKSKTIKRSDEIRKKSDRFIKR